MKKIIAAVMIMLIAVVVFFCFNTKAEPNSKVSMAAEKLKNHELAKENADNKQDNRQDKESVNESEKEALNEEKTTKRTLNDTTVKEVGGSSKKNDKTQDTVKKEQSENKNEQKNDVVEKPKHTHSWTPVYAERQVEKTKEVAWTKCYACGADMTGNISHIDQHLLNHESNVHYGTEYRMEVYYETETYISGYKCSCGKTK